MTTNKKEIKKQIKLFINLLINNFESNQKYLTKDDIEKLKNIEKLIKELTLKVIESQLKELIKERE